MAERKLKRTTTPDRLEKEIELNPENEKAILQWKCPTKETRSSRLRREMNAGKGGRIRSLTGSTEELHKDGSEWIRNKLFEQKKKIISLENEIEEVTKKNSSLEESGKAQLQDVFKLSEKTKAYETRIDHELKSKISLEVEMNNAKSKTLIVEEELAKLKTENEADKKAMNSMKDELKDKTMSLNNVRAEWQAEQAEKLRARKILENGMNKLKNKNEELTKHIDECLLVMKSQQIEITKLKKEKTQNENLCSTLNQEKVSVEQTCKKYEGELTERIKESLSMMDEMDEMKMIGSQQNLRIGESKKCIDQQKTDLQSKQIEIDDLVQSRERLEKTISQEKKDKGNLQNELIIQKTKIKDLQTSIANFSKGITEKADVINNFINENNLLKEKLSETTKCYEELLNDSVVEMDKHKVEAVSFEKTNEHLQHEADDLHTKCELLEKECEEERALRVEIQNENEKRKDKLEELKENVLSSVKGMSDKTTVINNLMKENNIMKEKINKDSSIIDQLVTERDSLQASLEKERTDNFEKVAELNSAITELNDRDQVSSAAVSRLSQEVEKCIIMIDQKTELADRLQDLLNSQQKNSDVDNDIQRGQIKTLQTDLEKKSNELEQKDSLVSKLNSTVEQLNQKYAQKEHVVEALKLEQQNFKILDDKNEKLKTVNEAQANELNELKTNLSVNADKYQLELKKNEKNHSREVNQLQDELDMSLNKSKEEINELLNNFSDLENELSFCQDELTSKVNEAEELQNKLNKANLSHLLKEKQLLKDLESLNEQNENILQNEIKKHKSDNENIVLEMKQQNSDQLEKMQIEFQAKVTSLKNQHEENKAKEIQKCDDKHLKVIEEKASVQKALEQNEVMYEKEIKSSQLQIKSKSIEIDSKSRITEKLARRIETQQKLIDYLMKSLEQERSKRGDSSKDIMMKLSHLQTQIDDKLGAYDTATTIKFSPYSSLMPSLANSEFHLAPPPAPTQTGSHDKLSTQDVSHDEFIPMSSSSPERKHMLSKTMPNLSNGDNVKHYLDSINGDHLSQSMPEPYFRDQGYHSPSHETSTISFYFAEQLKAITNTFDKIEHLDSNNSPAEQFNLEIWKQKIHFRLRVLEDQMSEIDSNSNHSSNSSVKSLSPPRPKQDTNGNVIFHPNTQEIRYLIDSVNRKYQNMNRKYRAISS